MRVKLLNLDYFKLLKAIFFFIIAFVIFMIIYFPTYSKLKKLRNTNKNLSSQITTLEDEITELQEKLSKVKTDPQIYEKIARDELGVAKENEIVIDIKE